jgi:hypothetical protein
MDAMISETDDDGRPIAYNRVAGLVVTGNEDGAHHVIAEVCGALGDIGFTIPGQAWTYWNRGPGPGDDYLDTEEGHEWIHETGRAAARNLIAGREGARASADPAPARGLMALRGPVGPARTAADGSVDEQRDDGADYRADDPGGLQGALVEVLAEDQVAEEAADEAAHDPEQGRRPESHRIGAGDEQPGEVAGDYPDYEQVDDQAEHGTVVPR